MGHKEGKTDKRKEKKQKRVKAEICEREKQDKNVFLLVVN